MFLKLRKNLAFTLAEVLITLGIIGVVAALTIPTLVNNFQKHETVVRLKKAYTVLYQALDSSQAANGYISTWDRSMLSTTNISRQNWFNTYLADYMKYLKTDITYNSSIFYVYLADGEILGFQSSDTGYITVIVFLSKDAIVNPSPGRDEFYFVIGLQDKNYLRPYDGGFTTGQNDRNFWIDQSTYGCNKTSTYKSFCAGLIMYDGWQIKDDYPYFND